MTTNTIHFPEFSGQSIKGYELQELIGKGGFGAVYRALQPAVRREVAVKVILPEYVNSPEFIRRFEAEAQLIAHLEHLHIVPLYDYWRDPQGAFLVMRWFRGGNLRGALEKELWQLNEVMHLVDQIGSALSLAHRNGVIHRDLKPDNILLDEERNAYLTDFGIARDLQNWTNLESLYLTEDKLGMLMGSPHYLSPEQIKAEAISPQSDIYSFGILLYEILTGRTPFHGSPMSTLITKHLQEPIPPLSLMREDLPEVLNRVINRATEKDPAARYSSIAALVADFRDALLSSHVDLDYDAVHTRISPLSDITAVDEAPLELVNPYKGLRAFQEADAVDFFGREAFIQQLLDRMQNDNLRFISVVGPSGSGKSSTVKAGLIPRLRKDALPGSSHWFIVEMTPGAHPLEELETALLRIAVTPPTATTILAQLREDERGLVRAVKRVLPGEETQLLLVIDQFEEVFTQLENEDERRHLLALLLAASQDASNRLRLITTLRADFYDRPLLYPEFGELMRQSTEVILPLKRDELEQAITRPAENVGLELEAGLVSEMLNDVAEQPGPLPLMQYALTELFERRSGRFLTIQAYRDIGGVSGALARRADDLLAEMSENDQQLAQQVFLRLVSINEGAEDTRRRVKLTELLSLEGNEADIQRITDQFGKYRLLTFDHDHETRTPTVEVAHEALIRQWRHLRGWIDDNRENLRIQRRLSAATEEWLNAGKDPSYLAAGTRLDQFEAWVKDTNLKLTGNEFAYLDASLAQRAKQQEAERARQAKEAALERRSRNFLRALVGVFAVATAGALFLSLFAFNQRSIAEQNAVTATIAQGEALMQADNAATAAAVAQVNEAQARSLAFASGAQLALSNNNTDLAILLALAANDGDYSTVQTRRTLAEAAYAPGTRRVFTGGHTDRVTSLAYRPDGKLAISGARDNLLILWDVETGQIIRQLEGHTDWVWDVAFSPDGTQALSASQDKTLILWDIQTGQIVRRFEGHNDAVRSLAFSSDGSQALSGSTDKTLILWDVMTGESIRQFASDSQVYAVAFSQNGFTALSGGDSSVITLWNVQAGEPLIRLGADGNGHTSQIWGVAYTPDEQAIVSASDDGTLILWSFETAQPLRRFQGHNSRVTSLDLSPDGSMVVSGSEDNSVIVWDTTTAAVLHRFSGHNTLVYDVAFSPDGRQVMSASWDTTLRLWDLENGAQLHRFDDHSAPVLSVAYSPDGSQALSASADSALILWDAATWQPVHRLEGHTGAVNSVAFSPDGTTAVSGSDDLSLILWDLNTGQSIRQMGGAGSDVGHSDGVWAVAVSPDGKTAASGARDNTIILWDLTSGEQINRLFGHTFRITGVAFSPDGSQLISSSFDNLLILWDVSNGTEIRRFEGHTDWVRSVAFSPDGQLVLSGSADNTVILWDTASGKRLRQFEGHTAQVFSVAFSHDGQLALSGSADSTVIVWDVLNGGELRRFNGHTDEVRGVSFGPDDATVLSGAGDSTVRLWQVTLTLEGLTGWIKANRYIRDLTCVERALYNAEPLCPTPTPVFGPNAV
jgi:WD40 repeat protein/serine/threonine protein kinase